MLKKLMHIKIYETLPKGKTFDRNRMIDEK